MAWIFLIQDMVRYIFNSLTSKFTDKLRWVLQLDQGLDAVSSHTVIGSVRKFQNQAESWHNVRHLK